MSNKVIWKDIPGYEGLYQISNLGNVKSLNYKGSGKKVILKKQSKNGYLSVVFSKNGKTKRLSIHRLVMLTFIGESNLQVNHKNGIKHDNRVENLEYCTQSENIKHSYSSLGRKASLSWLGKFGKDNPRSKQVNQYDLNGNFITRYNSISEAMRITGINNISKCCLGIYKTVGNFIWKYEI